MFIGIFDVRIYIHMYKPSIVFCIMITEFLANVEITIAVFLEKVEPMTNYTDG